MVRFPIVRVGGSSACNDVSSLVVGRSAESKNASVSFDSHSASFACTLYSRSAKDHNVTVDAMEPVVGIHRHWDLCCP